MPTAQNPMYQSTPTDYAAAIRGIATALNGTPQDRLAQEQLALEQARSDASIAGIQSQIAEREANVRNQEAQLGLAKELNAAQIANYQASAAKSAAEKDSLARQLQGLVGITSATEQLFKPANTPAVNAPVNPLAAGPTQIPAGVKPQEQTMREVAALVGPLLTAQGGKGEGLGNALAAITAMAANTGGIAPQNIEQALRISSTGAGHIPDLNTAITPGRQTELLNLKAQNELALKQAEPTTMSNLEAQVAQKALSGQPLSSMEVALLNRGTKQQQISVDPTTGAVSINETSGGSGFGQVANNQIDKALLDADKNLINLRSVQTKFDPSFTTIPGKAGAEVTDLMDKFQMGSATPEDMKKLEDYSTFAQATMSSLNDYIRSITGAALSPGEVQRALAVMPNIGTGGIAGIFQGDGPTRFKAKLDSMINMIEAVKRRSLVLKQQGINQLTDEMLAGNPGLSLDNFTQSAQPQQPQSGLAGQLGSNPATSLKQKYGLE